MAVLPTFEPENASYGRTGQAVLSGEEQGQSMMDRATRLQLAQQQQSDLHNEIVAKMPLIQAQAQLEQEKARAALHGAMVTTDLEQRAARESSGFNSEFQDILAYNPTYDVPASDGTPEGDAEQKLNAKYATQQMWNERATRLAALQPKIAYMSQLPQYKPFVDAVNNARIQMQGSALANAKLEEQLATNANTVAGRDINSQRAADARAELETQKAAHAKELAGVKSQLAVSLIKQHQSLSDPAQLNEKAAEYDDLALSNPDQADVYSTVARQLRDRATRVSQPKSSNRDALIAAITGEGPAAPAPKPGTAAPAPAPAPVQPSPEPIPNAPAGAPAAPEPIPSPKPGEAVPVPASAAPVAPTKIKTSDIQIAPSGDHFIVVAGKPHVLHKDAKGHIAYNLGGHWIPVETE